MEDEFTLEAKLSVKKLPDEVFEYLDQQESWDWDNRIIEKFEVFKDADGDINRVVTTEKRRNYTLEWQYSEGNQKAYNTEKFTTLGEAQSELKKANVFEWQNNSEVHRVELHENIWRNAKYDTDDYDFKMGDNEDGDILDLKLFGTQEDEVQELKSEIMDRLSNEFGIQDIKYQKLIVVNSDNGEEVGSMQVRISEHSQAAHNIDWYGGENDYFISIVFAEVDPTIKKHNRGTMRSNVTNIDIDSGDNSETAFDKIDDAISDALQRIQSEKEITSEIMLQKEYDNYNKKKRGGTIGEKHSSLGTAKELKLTTKVAGHDMIAECADCGDKFSYDSGEDYLQWECPYCVSRKNIS